MGQNKRIFLASPHMSEEGYELDYIREAFDENWIAPLGKNVTCFEDELSEYVGLVKGHAAALSSGTAAIHLALRAAGVGLGDEVFCSSFTFAASANPIIYQGAVPVFIDSDRETWNMCPLALERAFREHHPKAVVVVHLYGISADMDRISMLCAEHEAVLIEDAAESLGTLYKGRHTGTLGSYGIYSFNGNKIITTSGGGMLVSDNQEMIEKVKFWASQSREKERHYQHSELGFNYRMSNISAGIGRGQLRVLDRRVDKKRQIFEFYTSALSGLDGLEMMPTDSNTSPNRWLSCITVRDRVSSGEVIDALERENIESRPLWKPMHLQPFYKDCAFYGDGVSEELFGRGVCLPSDTKMNYEDMERVAQVIRGIWGR